MTFDFGTLVAHAYHHQTTVPVFVVDEVNVARARHRRFITREQIFDNQLAVIVLVAYKAVHGQHGVRPLRGRGGGRLIERTAPRREAAMSSRPSRTSTSKDLGPRKFLK
jgi:hypothetical protein